MISGSMITFVMYAIVGIMLYGWLVVANNLKTAGEELNNNSLEKAGKIMSILIFVSICFTILGIAFIILS